MVKGPMSWSQRQKLRRIKPRSWLWRTWRRLTRKRKHPPMSNHPTAYRDYTMWLFILGTVLLVLIMIYLMSIGGTSTETVPSAVLGG